MTMAVTRRRGGDRRRTRPAAPRHPPRAGDRARPAAGPSGRCSPPWTGCRWRSPLGTALSSVTAVLRGSGGAGRAGRSAARRHGRAAGHRADRPRLTPPRSTASCTPAGTTCTPPCWPGRPGCWPRAGRELAGQRGVHVPARRGGPRAAPGYMIDEGVLDAAGPAAGRRLRAARRVGRAAPRGVQQPAGPDDGRGRGARRSPSTAAAATAPSRITRPTRSPRPARS